MKILGISAFYHDSAACVLDDGEIVAAVQEERFTRKKHDDSFPVKSIEYCLGTVGVAPKGIDYVAFYEKPFLKFERLIETYLAYAPFGLRSFIKAMPVWMKKKLWIKDIIRKELNYDGPIIFPEHHESHAASAFYPSPYNESAILTLDGVGEWATTSYGIGSGNNIELLSGLKFPNSLGLLYSAFTYYTGFKVNSGEYKLMGLAPYGEPRYKQRIVENLVDIKGDGSFRLNMEYFDYCSGLTMTSRKFYELFDGPPRKPETALTQREMDIARSIQDVTDEIVTKTARHIKTITGMRTLCMAGGVALNCVSNGKIIKDGIFDEIWVQPAAGDAGGALGAALFTWHQYLNMPRVQNGQHDKMHGAYLGPAYDDAEIAGFLDGQQIPYTVIDKADIPEKIADLINDGMVIGLFNGRMEYGPRALGARSIIADARNSSMQENMNIKIKFRESFRPFAPSVLAERVSDYFDFEGSSPYMLIVADVHKDRRINNEQDDEKLFGVDKLKMNRSDIPAVTHVDYSARIQTVHKETNPLYYNIISAFERKYGCPVIINTSFNVRGEPIVCTYEDAYRCFIRTNMDYLLLGNCLLTKSDKHMSDTSNWQCEYELD